MASFTAVRATPDAARSSAYGASRSPNIESVVGRGLPSGALAIRGVGSRATPAADVGNIAPGDAILPLGARPAFGDGALAL